MYILVTTDESADPEVGARTALVDKGPPTSVVIPIYRRDCHEEVYAGTHAYPGQVKYILIDSKISLIFYKIVNI